MLAGICVKLNKEVESASRVLQAYDYFRRTKSATDAQEHLAADAKTRVEIDEWVRQSSGKEKELRKQLDEVVAKKKEARGAELKECVEKEKALSKLLVERDTKYSNLQESKESEALELKSTQKELDKMAQDKGKRAAAAEAAEAAVATATKSWEEERDRAASMEAQYVAQSTGGAGASDGAGAGNLQSQLSEVVEEARGSNDRVLELAQRRRRLISRK